MTSWKIRLLVPAEAVTDIEAIAPEMHEHFDTLPVRGIALASP